MRGECQIRVKATIYGLPALYCSVAVCSCTCQQQVTIMWAKHMSVNAHTRYKQLGSSNFTRQYWMILFNQATEQHHLIDVPGEHVIKWS